MSVPSVFATGHHLNLSLSGSRVTILDSLKVNSLAASVHHNYRETLNNHEVLPSITPTDSRSVSQESLHMKTRGIRQVISHINNNETVVKNCSKSEFRKETVEDCWQEVLPVDSNKGDESEDLMVSEEKADDLWEDEADSDEEVKETTSNAGTKKRKHKKKKKKSSRHVFKSAKSDRLKNTEEIYTDMAVTERQSKLEAFCIPVTIGSLSRKGSKKSGSDYLKYVNEKAPVAVGAPKLQSQVRTDKLLVKTKELLTVVSAKSNSLKEKFIKATKSPGGLTNKLKSNLTASADAVTFQLQIAKSGPNVSRKLLSSAPCDKEIPRITKVYLSEKQSRDIWELGMEYPGAPPPSPTADMLKRFEYVPSMNDIRSQRAVKLKLDYLVKIEKQRQEKIKEEKSRKDKVHQKERIRELRRQQRREIYALNKEMTNFENNNFREFCRQNGIDPES